VYYEAKVKNTPDEHGQRPSDGDIVDVFACRVVENEDGDVLRMHEVDPDDDGLDFLKDAWVGVYVTYRDGRAQAVLDLAVPRDDDGDIFGEHLRADLPSSAIAIVDLLADLPLGALDRFVCQALDLPITG